MSVELESKRRIANLIASANEATGKEDTDLTAAVGSLIAGIQAGGGVEELIASLVDRSYSGEFVIPDGVTKIKSYFFYDYPNMIISALPESLNSLPQDCFRKMPGVSIKRLPDATKTLSKYSFCYCNGLFTELSIPEDAYIGSSFCFQCDSLASVTFRGKAFKINSDAFNQCRALITINVPWAEGEVANAPWGATNATINYNYTGG